MRSVGYQWSASEKKKIYTEVLVLINVVIRMNKNESMT